MAILATVATSMVTLARLVLTVTMVVVRLAMGRFSPRIARSILQDTTSRLAIGLFVGTFAHATIASLLLLVDHVHVSTLIELVRDRLRELVDDPAGEEALAPGPGPGEITAARSGVVVHIATGDLVDTAGEADCTLEVVPAMGDHVPVASGPRAHRAAGRGDRPRPRRPPRGARLRAHARPGPRRRHAAARSTSPSAVSPSRSSTRPPRCRRSTGSTTACAGSCGARSPTGASATMTAAAPWPRTMDWAGHVDLAFEEIRRAGATSPQVARRLAAALDDPAHHRPAGAAPAARAPAPAARRAGGRGGRRGDGRHAGRRLGGGGEVVGCGAVSPGLYTSLVRPLLFRLDPERAHELAIGGLAAASPVLGRLRRPPTSPALAVDALGLRFPNPVGLAAGLDKRAAAVPAWPALGFGFAEIGTVTAEPQPGNPRPRIHRLPADRALINRLGFNNEGAEATARRLARWRRRGLLGRAPLGVNLGKSKVTPPEAAPADYARSLEALWGFADYVTVNVSSPNTPGLRDLQAAGPLGEILAALDAVNRRLARAHGRPPRSVLVKLAPDLEPGQADAAVDLALERGLAGVIVTNTTLRREGLASPPTLAALEGGLSGAPLRERSTAMVRRVAARAGGALAVVGVGGVFDADDAWEKLAAGAALVQVYTGFVYGGPGTARAICAGLEARMAREGVARVAEIGGGGRR